VKSLTEPPRMLEIAVSAGAMLLTIKW
jgi:hypothetical protein